ncbi:DUF6950 family protein [Martelella limonii]|uniref:DUF6950 family protein n=1 Tax=Martelella limonii TaxID=1647649 RepID=UPI00157FF2B6|nr:hypothetical protein [Martelella limonii]
MTWADWIAQWSETPITWGVDDCSAFAALWIKDARGIDVPLPQWSSRKEAKRLIAEAGSLYALWQEALAKSHIYEIPIHRVRTGDVGILNTTISGPVGGIFFAYGGGFASRFNDGVKRLPVRPANVIAAWSVGYQGQ